jgi:hypothetical protein
MQITTSCEDGNRVLAKPREYRDYYICKWISDATLGCKEIVDEPMF